VTCVRPLAHCAGHRQERWQPWLRIQPQPGPWAALRALAGTATPWVHPPSTAPVTGVPTGLAPVALGVPGSCGSPAPSKAHSLQAPARGGSPQQQVTRRRSQAVTGHQPQAPHPASQAEPQGGVQEGQGRPPHPRAPCCWCPCWLWPSSCATPTASSWQSLWCPSPHSMPGPQPLPESSR